MLRDPSKSVTDLFKPNAETLPPMTRDQDHRPTSSDSRKFSSQPLLQRKISLDQLGSSEQSIDHCVACNYYAARWQTFSSEIAACRNSRREQIRGTKIDCSAIHLLWEWSCKVIRAQARFNVPDFNTTVKRGD